MNLFRTFTLFFVIALTVSGCSSQPEKMADSQEPVQKTDNLPAEITSGSEAKRTFPHIMENPNPNGMLTIYDPLEPFNRTMYNFNYRFDKYVFLPAVSGYQYVTPVVVQDRISSFFANLKEIPYFINNLLQFELKDTGITTARFLINSTLGGLGLWDVATKMDIYVRKEDFGMTLAKWGVGNGAYLVLPIFGPSSLRDAGGLAVDSMSYGHIVTDDFLDLDDANKDDIRVGLAVLNAVDTRKNTAFRYYETGSPFEYELIRYAYIRKRMVEEEANQ